MLASVQQLSYCMFRTEWALSISPVETDGQKTTKYNRNVLKKKKKNSSSVVSGNQKFRSVQDKVRSGVHIQHCCYFPVQSFNIKKKKILRKQITSLLHKLFILYLSFCDILLFLGDKLEAMSASESVITTWRQTANWATTLRCRSLNTESLTEFAEVFLARVEEESACNGIRLDTEARSKGVKVKTGYNNLTFTPKINGKVLFLVNIFNKLTLDTFVLPKLGKHWLTSI